MKTVRYHHIEDGAARATHRAVHYIPEVLNTLSTLLLGALGFIDGNTRWLLLAMGGCFFLAGTTLGRKRDRDYRHERDKVAQLEADNLEERNAMRRVLERLAHELCVELSLWDESTRVTIYGHIEDGTASGFLPLARCSNNPRYEKLGRSFYEDTQVGYLGVAWEDGRVQRSFRSSNGARENLWKPSTDRDGQKRKPPLTREQAEALTLTMEPRSVIGIRLDGNQGSEKHGVILFESMKNDSLNTRRLNELTNAPQVRSLKIVMNAVSALFRSITIAQATEEAEQLRDS